MDVKKADDDRILCEIFSIIPVSYDTNVYP